MKVIEHVEEPEVVVERPVVIVVELNINRKRVKWEEVEKELTGLGRGAKTHMLTQN
jgi:hypothetical protein